MIIGVVGRIAAGKNTVLELLQARGYEFVKLSKALHDEAKKLGISGDRAKLQDLGNKLRKEGGGGILAKMLLEGLDLKKNYVIDGIRNHNEVIELKKAPGFVLISVDASQRLRHERASLRGKEYDTKTWEEFVAIDDRDFCEKDKDGRIVELGQQVGKCMEMADFRFTNNSDLESFKNDIRKVIEEIESNEL